MKKTAHISIVTTEEIKTKLERKAKEEERSISWIIHKILEEHYKKEINGTEHSEQVQGG